MKLTCYQLQPHAVEIVPGRPEREWMDETTDRSAYRCLPLTIANTTGWELICPVGFRATWSGKPEGSALKIEGPFNAPNAHAPYIHTYFGNGVLTFHTGYRFQTEKGWDLWVGGPPNTIKHGIAPLTGIVETDWLPQPFTMNWRFTAPGTVAFAAGEPMAFIMLLPHAAIDAVEPVIEQLAAHPEEDKATRAWNDSRLDFLKTAPPDDWQRNYFQGTHPDGRPGSDTHISRRRLKPPRRSGS